MNVEIIPDKIYKNPGEPLYITIKICKSIGDISAKGSLTLSYYNYRTKTASSLGTWNFEIGMLNDCVEIKTNMIMPDGEIEIQATATGLLFKGAFPFTFSEPFTIRQNKKINISPTYEEPTTTYNTSYVLIRILNTKLTPVLGAKVTINNTTKTTNSSGQVVFILERNKNYTAYVRFDNIEKTFKFYTGSGSLTFDINLDTEKTETIPEESPPTSESPTEEKPTTEEPEKPISDKINIQTLINIVSLAIAIIVSVFIIRKK